MENKLLKKLLFSCILIFGTITYAQTVSGVVTDAQGPMAGVNIIVKGTSTGVQSDFDGKYSLDAGSSEAVLVFSYVGYISQEIQVNLQTSINVTLLEDASLLDEVIVIGYGTTTVKDATGAVASIKSEDFNGGVILSPEQLIQGKTAGVQISQSSGEPGAGIAIRIRGTASVRSNNNPLFVVDGIPLADGGTPGGGDLGVGGSSAKNPLGFLNPGDIENITILKDASATAIYGSRGANGVVLITTKSGKAGGGGLFEFNTSVSTASPSNRFDLLDRYSFLKGVAQYGGDAEALDYGNNTDWQDVVTRSAESTTSGLSYSNNYGDGYVRASFGYSDVFGVIKNSEQERITGRLNATHRFFDNKLKLDFNGTMSRVNNESPLITSTNGSLGDLLGAAYFANPTWPNSPLFTSGSGDLNPAQLLAYYQDTANTDRLLGNIAAEYTIVPDLKAKVNLGYDDAKAYRTQVLSAEVDGFNNGTPGNGRGSYQEVFSLNKLMDLTLNWQKDFGNSDLEVLVGYSYQSFNSRGKTINGFGFNTTDLNGMASDLVDATDIIESGINQSFQTYGYNSNGLFINQIVPEIIGGIEVTAPSRVPVRSVTGDWYNNTDELQSYFGRINYTIAGKYLFTATMRADGSSRFGPNNQYGYFPSGAFAWQLQDENFIPDAFSTLKLRLGYGITGNQDGLGYGNFTQRQRFSAPGINNDGSINLGGTNIVSFQNDDLKWEETSQAGVGLDFGFFENRLSGTLDFYYKDTKDLLLKVDAAQPAVQPFVFSNLDADVINQGVEFSLSYDIIQQEDMNWNFGFNIGYNKNEVQNFDGLVQTGEINGNGLTGAYSQLLAEGQPLFSFYLREFGGYDENGITIYPNGDKQEFVGASALPDYTVGINTSFTYKNWDLNAYLNGQYGQYVYNNTANAYQTAGIIGVGKNVPEYVLTNGESTANAPDVSTRFLEKGDFLRLSDLSLGYSFNMKEKGFLKSLRLVATGQNLFIITPYSGLDPEVDTPKSLNNIPSAGIDYTSYPKAVTYTLGLNATF